MQPEMSSYFFIASTPMFLMVVLLWMIMSVSTYQPMGAFCGIKKY